MKVVKVGCCGFPVSRSKYYSEYRVVELQNTFYDLPSIEWAEEVRREAPESFEFAVKAWQVITHPSTSPTWRKMRRKPSGRVSNYGHLKPTSENVSAYAQVVELARALRSKLIILQAPSSMTLNGEFVERISEFFKQVAGITPRGVIVGLELRGNWRARSDLLAEVFREHGVLHVTDLFRSRPLHNPSGIVYTRLHGIGPREVNYRYKYTSEDFERLTRALDEINFAEAYVLFNNVYMLQDSRSYKKYLAENANYEVL